MSDANTLLVLSGNGIPPYAAIGLHQTLEPIWMIRAQQTSTVLRRTVNGTLVSLVPPQMYKYRSEITGSYQRPPAFDGVWTGLQLTVDCLAELAYPNGGTAQRPAVDTSQYDGGDGYTYYRPRLTMLVADFSADTDEWGAQVGWKLVLEEV